MKIAIPCAEGKLCQHFGHCEVFAIVETDEQNQIMKQDMAIPPAHEPGLLPKWLSEKNVELIIAGGMGMRAQLLFDEKGIKVVTGAPFDTPENIIEAFLAETLVTGENTCDH